MWRKSRDLSWLVVNVSVLGRKCVVWQDMVCRFDVSPDFAGSLYGMLPVLTGTLSCGLWKVFFFCGKCVVCTRGFSSFSVFQ